MKFKAVISIILATLLCLMMLPVSALAGSVGDVDANGKVDATDARLALRAAVGLDTLTENAKKAADVDFNNTVDATDARLILRAAVGLESLHEHSFAASVTKEASCEEKGVKTFACSCGEAYTEDIPATGHTEVTDKAIAPTKTETGLTEGSHCSVCNKVLKAQEIIPALGNEPGEPVHSGNHEFKTVSITSATKCSVPGCDAEIPAFNDIVNVLKDYGDGLNYFTAVFEDISHYDEPVVSGMLAGMMEEESIGATTETTFSPLVVDRLITKNNFHSKGADFVSNLADSDVKSIKIEKVSTVGFVSTLPEKFKSGKFEYDISAIKAYDFPELYKITLVLPDQSVDISKPVKGTSVYDKIYTQNYNMTLENMRLEVSSGFSSLEQEMAGLEGMIKMKNSGSVNASLTVEYYVTADNFVPVAAKYGHVLDVSFEIKVTDAIGVTKYLTMLQNMDMTSNMYYFFNNNFGIQ